MKIIMKEEVVFWTLLRGKDWVFLLGGGATFSFESTADVCWTFRLDYASEASYVGEKPLCVSLGGASFAS